MAESKLIVNLTRGSSLCVAEVADRPLRRMRGLMGRRGLVAGAGMLIVPAPAVHTAFMRFPIDVLFLDREMRVVKLVEELAPWRIARCRGARAVLELGAGEISSCEVSVGDCLEVRDSARRRRGRRNRKDDVRPVQVPVEPGVVSEVAAEVAASRQRTHLAVVADQSGDVPAAAEPSERAGAAGFPPPPNPSAHASQEPLQVAVISADLHFRTAMSLLLTPHDFIVIAAADPARLPERAASSDIVVLDAGPDPAVALALVGAHIHTSSIVLVAEEVSPLETGLPVVAKWGPLSVLLREIERAADRSRNALEARL